MQVKGVCGDWKLGRQVGWYELNLTYMLSNGLPTEIEKKLRDSEVLTDKEAVEAQKYM